MDKIKLLFLIISISSTLYSQDIIDTSQVKVEYVSRIIDHSGIQPYITAHPIFDKKQPFFEGFRIQIFSGNSKVAANKVKADFYRAHPYMRCYLTYQQPYYKLRVGDYEDPESAKKDVKKLVREYPTCFLVPDNVRRTGNLKSDK